MWCGQKWIPHVHKNVEIENPSHFIPIFFYLSPDFERKMSGSSAVYLYHVEKNVFKKILWKLGSTTPKIGNSWKKVANTKGLIFFRYFIDMSLFLVSRPLHHRFIFCPPKLLEKGFEGGKSVLWTHSLKILEHCFLWKSLKFDTDKFARKHHCTLFSHLEKGQLFSFRKQNFFQRNPKIGTLYFLEKPCSSSCLLRQIRYSFKIRKFVQFCLAMQLTSKHNKTHILTSKFSYHLLSIRVNIK